MKYNPKIDYVFCRDFFYGPKKNNDEMRKRRIYKKELKPRSLQERLMRKAKRILIYIKRAKFSLSSLQKCYFLLTSQKMKLTEKKQEYLLNIIKKYRESPMSYFPYEAFSIVIKRKVFPKKWNLFMAEIIHNFIRIKENKTPVIFSYGKTKNVLFYIENHQNEKALMEFQQLYKRVDALNQVYPYLSLTKVMKIIRKEKEYLKKSFFVDELWIYGSYARKEATKYSDIDVYILVSKKEMLNKELHIMMYLTEKIGRVVDGHIEMNTHHNTFNLPGPRIKVFE